MESSGLEAGVDKFWRPLVECLLLAASTMASRTASPSSQGPNSSHPAAPPFRDAKREPAGRHSERVHIKEADTGAGFPVTFSMTAEREGLEPGIDKLFCVLVHSGALVPFR